jgi:cytochrome c553
VRRGPHVLGGLLKLLADEEQSAPARIAALGAAQPFWCPKVEAAMIRLLEAESPDLRRLAANALSLHTKPRDREAHEALLRVLGDEEPAVRRAVALAMGRIGGPGSAENLANALSFDDGKDTGLTEGLLRAVERRGKEGMEELLNLANSGDRKGIDQAVAAFLLLRSRAGADALPRMLANPHLTTEQQAALLRSYRSYRLERPLSVAPVVDYLARHPDAEREVKQAGLEAIVAAGAPRSEKTRSLLLRLLDEKDAGLRTLLLRAVAQAGAAKAGPRLARWLSDTARPAEERLQVLRALQAIDPAEARRAASRLLVSKDRPLQAEAVRVLATDAEGARRTGQMWLDGKLPSETLPEIADALRRRAPENEALDRMLELVMRRGLTKTAPEQVEAAVRGADPWRGRSVYLDRKTARCIECHRVEGAGGKVSPDLTRLADRRSTAQLLRSLVEPKKDEKRDNPHLSAAKRLSHQDLLDLAAFLKSHEARESLRGLALEFWAVGPFPWQPVAAERSGLLDLAGRRSGGGTLLTYVYSPRPQHAELRLASADGVRVWLNGCRVHKQAARQTSWPDADRVAVSLKAGWNAVLLKAARARADSRLYLRFIGGDGLRVARSHDGK